jgi:hypothetical protein
MRAVHVYRLKAPRIVDKNWYPPCNGALSGLTNFFNRPWFYHVWIIQETACAKDAIVVFGHDWLSWTELCDACDEISDMVAKTSTKNPFIDTGFNGTSQIRRLGRRRALGAPEADWGLMELLALFNGYRATDAHDKVYALLGLAKETRANYDMTAHAMILPDYNDTLPVTFNEVVRFMVMNTSKLDILRCCEGAWRMKSLPTWVPDWTAIVHRNFNVHKTQTKPYALDSDPSPSTPIARFNDDLTTMTVRGFLIGYLVDDGYVMYSTKDPASPDHLTKFGFNFDWILWFAGHGQSLLIRSGLGSLLLTSIFSVVGYFGPELKPVLALYKEMFADLGRQ